MKVPKQTAASNAPINIYIPKQDKVETAAKAEMSPITVKVPKQAESKAPINIYIPKQEKTEVAKAELPPITVKVPKQPETKAPINIYIPKQKMGMAERDEAAEKEIQELKIQVARLEERLQAKAPVAKKENKTSKKFE